MMFVVSASIARNDLQRNAAVVGLKIMPNLAQPGRSSAGVRPGPSSRRLLFVPCTLCVRFQRSAVAEKGRYC